nr:pectin acetylesterase 8-like [Ipomoea batatas]
MNAQHCKYRGPSRLGSSEYMYPVIGMGDMMSNTPDENPEFYNWHRVHVAYCDGSSFTSDVDGVDPVTNLTYRGARIFYALMEDFQAKGMKNAKNTYAEVFADWYFDRNTSPIRVIPKSEKPLNCSTFEANPRQP